MKNIKIRSISNKQITSNKEISSLFKSISIKKINKININNNLLCGDFFLDTSSYFPITRKDLYVFPDLFNWNQDVSRFLDEKSNFSKNFYKNNQKFQEISNVFVLGTSPGNNFYRNIYTFINRLFFIFDKEIDIAIHRNTSNNIRKFIRHILDIKNVKLRKFVYLDDKFYLFRNSQIPGFLNFKDILKLYEFVLPPKKEGNEYIYISRRNANWRRIINETEFISSLEKNGFQIYDFENISIKNQILKIQSSKKIIAPHGSGLANLIFANPKIKVIEILHNNIEKKLIPIYLKYKKISHYKKNSHLSFGADSVKNNHFKNILNSENLVRHLSKRILFNNQYYDDFIINEDEFKKLIANFSKN